MCSIHIPGTIFPFGDLVKFIKTSGDEASDNHEGDVAMTGVYTVDSSVVINERHKVIRNDAKRKGRL